MIGLMLAFNVLIRRQWINHERLTYPLVVLPVEMTGGTAGGTGGFYADRLLWYGFAVAAAIDILNGYRRPNDYSRGQYDYLYYNSRR